MTLRQRLLKLVYPLFLLLQRIRSKQTILVNKEEKLPASSFYDLSATLSNGENLSFETLRGKKVLIVNTASDCVFTAQYEELQKLYQHSKEDLVILAFPANDFKNQEEKTDKEIVSFCQVNYGIRFPLAKKSVVIKREGQHPVFRWLSNRRLNGWNEQAPRWNFSKYLVNEKGVLTHYFDPSVSPLGTEMISAVHQ